MPPASNKKPTRAQSRVGAAEDDPSNPPPPPSPPPATASAALNVSDRNFLLVLSSPPPPPLPPLNAAPLFSPLRAEVRPARAVRGRPLPLPARMGGRPMRPPELRPAVRRARPLRRGREMPLPTRMERQTLHAARLRARRRLPRPRTLPGRTRRLQVCGDYCICLLQLRNAAIVVVSHSCQCQDGWAGEQCQHATESDCGDYEDNDGSEYICARRRRRILR